MYYKLVGKEVVPCSSTEWGSGLNETRRVGEAVLGGVRISTVFLGIDHQYGDGPPLLFETMVFGLKDGSEPQDRYSTWEEAEFSFQEWVQLIALECDKTGFEPGDHINGVPVKNKDDV